MSMWEQESDKKSSVQKKLFESGYMHLEFEKWRAICSSVGGVGSVRAWEVYLRGWRPIIIVTVITEILSWRKKYWVFTFENKNEKMFQINLSSDLKEEPYLKSRYWFILFETVTIS